MDVRCQCGAVSFKTPSDEPKKLYHCHCSQCRKQSASAFGTSAVFTSEGVFPMDEALSEKMTIYARESTEKQDEEKDEEETETEGKRANAMVECYFCKQCGCRVLHRRRNEDGNSGGVVMIKGGLIEGLKWEHGVHIFTESAVVPIPEGAEQHKGAPPS